MFYPMVALKAIMKARHGTRPAGHWVVMRTTIESVSVLAMAYEWSQEGISFFISTCGSTEPDETKHVSNLRMSGDKPEVVCWTDTKFCIFFMRLPTID
jgi:hypothetical protein